MAVATKRALEYFLRLEKRESIAWGFGLIVVILAGDYVTGNQISLAHVYILPVLVLAWNAGFLWALLGACISGLLSLAVSVLTGSPFTGFGYLAFDIGSVLLVLLIAAAIAANLRKSHDALNQASITDHLTGIANRRGFEMRAGLELGNHRRYGGALSLLLIDCDNFKSVNDQYGHDTGDRLLIAIARVLQSGIRATDSAARLGGDEFVVLLPRTSREEASMVEQKLRASLNRMPELAAGVSFSMGLVCFAGGVPDQLSEVLKPADALLYEAKKEGKNAMRELQL